MQSKKLLEKKNYLVHEEEDVLNEKAAKKYAVTVKCVS